MLHIEPGKKKHFLGQKSLSPEKCMSGHINSAAVCPAFSTRFNKTKSDASRRAGKSKAKPSNLSGWKFLEFVIQCCWWFRNPANHLGCICLKKKMYLGYKPVHWCVLPSRVFRGRWEIYRILCTWHALKYCTRSYLKNFSKKCWNFILFDWILLALKRWSMTPISYRSRSVLPCSKGHQEAEHQHLNSWTHPMLMLWKIQKSIYIYNIIFIYAIHINASYSIIVVWVRVWLCLRYQFPWQAIHRYFWWYKYPNSRCLKWTQI